jgi:protease IV
MFGEEKVETKEDIERSVLEQVALQSVKEQRLKRRWSIFFRGAFLVYFIVLMISLWQSNESGIISEEKVPHIGIVDLKGIIADDSDARASYINRSLTAAFEAENTKAVIVRINSPGGSPVQSDEIYQHMLYLEKEYPNKPLYVVCTDVCASGGYYIASAAKGIYANKMSIVGSIGVIAAGFGFVGAIEKIGVKRRLYTAGDNKGFLDPFSPQNPKQKADMDKMLTQTHEVFIQSVEEGRGKRLDEKDYSVIFSGLPFSGVEANKLGLIDGFETVRTLATKKIGLDKYVNYSRRRSFFEKIVNDLGGQVAYKMFSYGNIKFQ